MLGCLFLREQMQALAIGIAEGCFCKNRIHQKYLCLILKRVAQTKALIQTQPFYLYQYLPLVEWVCLGTVLPGSWMARFGHLLGIGLLMILEVSLYHMQINPKANQVESFGLIFLILNQF